MILASIFTLALAVQPPTDPDIVQLPQAAVDVSDAPAVVPSTGDTKQQSSRGETQQKPADAKEPPTPPHTGIRALFGNFIEDIQHLPSLQNAYIISVGGALALAAHPADDTLNARLSKAGNAFAPGKYIGNTPEQVAASIGTYAIARWLDLPKVSHLGMDLLQAQMLAELLVEPTKFAVRRERPDGSNNLSFPSGHSAVTFATATVIERHLGWRYSFIGYGVASYVAISRLHDNQHFLSDVVFGAAVGTVAGRTVVHHASDYWTFIPVKIPDGGLALMAVRTF